MKAAAIFPGSRRVVWLVGGQDAGNLALASVEVFDPASGQFSLLGPGMLDARSQLGLASLLDGTLLAFSGLDGSGGVVRGETLDDGGLPDAVGPLRYSRQLPVPVTMPDGTVLVCGERDQGGHIQNSIEIYLP